MTLFGHTVFLDVFWSFLRFWARIDPTFCDCCLYEMTGCSDIDTHKEEGPVKMEAEIGIMESQTKEP